MSQPIFEFVGASDSALASLGPWEVTEPQMDAVSFDVGAPPADEQPTWRVNLPADVSDAGQSFAEAEAQIKAMQAALDAIPGKLDAFVVKSQPTESISFSASEAPVFEAGSPEAGLFDLLTEAERAEGAGTEVSFGIAESASEAWGQAKVQFAGLLDQVNREFLHMAWVETNREGALIARSTVGWGGDAATVWSQSVSNEEMSLHSRSLELALTSRQMRLRMFTTITTGATKLAIMLGSNPIGPIAALPVAWKYVQDVLAQVREYREIT